MKFFIVAGEKSGDKQGALLMKELLLRQPQSQFRGLGGEQMHALSSNIENWTEEAAVIGLVEVLKKFRYFKNHLDQMSQRIAEAQPDVLILIDYPGFNQRLAERVHRLCPATKIAWFIAPMVWAWNKGRIPKLARVVDLMLCTFPFEKEIFEDAGLHTEFVGHPLVDDILATKRKDVRNPRLIGLFPGSRKREIESNFPIFIEAVQMMRRVHPDWSFEASASSPQLEARMREMMQTMGLEASAIHISLSNYHDLMDRSQAALVTSGTATLEAALHELPFVLVYKVAKMTYWVARLLLKIRFIGMVNILIQRAVTKELIQYDFTAQNCVAELDRLMQGEVRELTLTGMRESMDKLGHGGAAAKAAKAILQLEG